jgi:hypothetical protein
MGEVLVRAFGYTSAARYLDNPEDMVGKRYSHIEAGELGDVAAEALEKFYSGVCFNGVLLHVHFLS